MLDYHKDAQKKMILSLITCYFKIISQTEGSEELHLFYKQANSTMYKSDCSSKEQEFWQIIQRIFPLDCVLKLPIGYQPIPPTILLKRIQGWRQQ